MKKKNILLVFTDQQRYDTIAALGNPIIKTPTIDELVRDGVSYTNAFSPCPVCVPARHAMVTGRMPYITDCVDNETSNYRKSFMEILSENGYQTLGVGKMHFTIQRDHSVSHDEQDIDSLLGTNNDIYNNWGFEKRCTSETRTDDDYETYVRENGFGHVGSPKGENSEMYYIPQPSQLPEELDETSWVVKESLNQLESRDQDRPFFMMTSFQRPHPPFVAPFPWNKLYRCAEMIPPVVPEDYENLLCFWNHFQNRYKYRDQGIDNNLIRTMKAYYYSSISFIDYNLSKLIRYLKENQLYEDTMIIFSSDHGEMLGDYHSFVKRCFLDSAARIPMIVKYPGCKKGQKIETPVSLIDIMPTILQYAGVNTDEEMDGKSLVDIAEKRVDREIVLGQFQRNENALYMAVSEEYKYIYSAPDQKEWLFNRKTDPYETRSLAYNPLYVKKTKEMRDHLIHQYRLIGREDLLDADTWKEMKRAEMPDDPDAYLLFQDMGEFKPDERYLTDTNMKKYCEPRWHQ